MVSTERQVSYISLMNAVTRALLAARDAMRLDQATKVGGDWWLSHWSNVIALLFLYREYSLTHFCR